jgi:hypothetical protein
MPDTTKVTLPLFPTARWYGILERGFQFQNSEIPFRTIVPKTKFQIIIDKDLVFSWLVSGSERTSCLEQKFHKLNSAYFLLSIP